MGTFAANLLGTEHFVGASTYRDGDGSNARIVLAIDVCGEADIAIEMILDTGAPYNVLRRALAQEVGWDTDAGWPTTLDTWIGRLDGSLVRGTMRWRADEGDGVEIEGTFFVPDVDYESLPNFLGYTGGLERLRFAVDPSCNTICFGPV